MTVWITRTRPGADRTAARLAELGLDSLVEPVLSVRPLAVELDLEGKDALAFTSANGVAAYAALTDERTLPAYAVGTATAEALNEAGFGQVIVAGGDVVALAQTLIAARPGRVLHIAPLAPSGDLSGLAGTAGVTVESLAIYETIPEEPQAALTASGLTAVLIHSARGAEAVAGFAADRLEALPVFALSEQAAEPLKALARAGLYIAPFPDEPSLLKLCADTLSDEPK